MERLPKPDKQLLENAIKCLYEFDSIISQISEMGEDYIDCSLQYSEGHNLGEVLYAIEFVENKLNSVLYGKSKYT